MARAKQLTPQQWANADLVMQATFGGTAKEILWRDQRNAIADDVETVEPYMPRKIAARVGSIILKDFRGDKSTLVRTKMSFAGTATFSSEDMDIPLSKALAYIHGLLKQKVPPGSKGQYRNNFIFFVNGGKMLQHAPPTPPGGWPYGTILGVANRMDYASTLEKPKHPQIFRKTLRQATAKYGGVLDLRLKMLTPKTIGATTPSGGGGYKGAGKYNFPVIQIAALNRMRGNTGIQTRRKRKKRK